MLQQLVSDATRRHLTCAPSTPSRRAARAAAPLPPRSSSTRRPRPPCASLLDTERSSSSNGSNGRERRAAPAASDSRRTTTAPERKSALQQTVMRYYNDVWNAGASVDCLHDSLDDLVADAVVFNDVLGHDSDSFGRRGLRQVVDRFQAGHPLAVFTVDDTVVDEDAATVVAHWHATAAHLLPTPHAGPATGQVSEITGMDKFHFSDAGRITSIVSYRERFADEESAQGGW